jgi:hypothetical protein
MIHLLLTLAVAFAVSACGSAVPPSGSPVSPSPSPDASVAVGPDALRYTCGAFPFGADLLTAPPRNDEQANNPAAAALRAHLLGAGPEIGFLPDAGWNMTGMDAQKAEFVAVGGEVGMAYVSVENGVNGWTVAGWGDCQPRVQLAAGLGSAEWAFDPAQPVPDATTQVFDALVTELSCNSGEPADGRIVGPQILKSGDTVLVVFAVRPRPGGQDCQSNPPTRVKVDLGEPLGARKLLDGGTLPPGDPAQPGL